MKLIPFSKEHLRLDAALPFPIRDSQGSLLLAANRVIASRHTLDTLHQLDLFTGEHETADWRRRVAEKVNGLFVEGATLKTIAQALPDATPRTTPKAPLTVPFAVELDTLLLQADALLRQTTTDGQWPQRFAITMQALMSLTHRRFDSATYLLIQHGSTTLERYSARHALLVAAVATETARLMEWPAAQRNSLFAACLSMNVAMTRGQDLLLLQTGPLTAAQRELVQRHPAQGAAMLEAAGVADPLWLDAVARHHQAQPSAPLARCSPGQRLAALIRRVDIFAAKLSRRAARAPMSPIQAAREACLGPDGQPDEIGSALLRAVGLYPPGSFVKLANGEVGVVIARGRRANLPIVASLVGPSGLPLSTLAVRDTVERRYAVQGAVLPTAVKVLPAHARILEFTQQKERLRTAELHDVDD